MKSEPPDPVSPKRKRTAAIFGISVLLMAAVVASPIYNSISTRTDRVNRMVEMRSLVTACIAYSKDWDKFPPNLEALYPNYIDDESFVTFDEEGKQPYLYRPGLVETDYSREPLIISPPDENGKRLIGFVGGHVTEESLEPLPPEILEQFKPLQ